MARARNIKPGFFTNDELVELSFAVRLLFIGLWTIADKEGRLADRPKKIKMEIFPADDVDINASLGELQDKGFLRRYEVAGVRYIQIVNWAKHQNPHIKEAPSLIPDENGQAPEIPVQAPEIPEGAGLIVDSLNLIPDSLIADSAPNVVAMHSPSAKPKSKPRAKNLCSLPDDFVISDRVQRWAQEKNHGSLERHFENFVSAARAKGYEYVDWDEAFMKAIRENWAKVDNKKNERRFVY